MSGEPGAAPCAALASWLAPDLLVVLLTEREAGPAGAGEILHGDDGAARALRARTLELPATGDGAPVCLVTIGAFGGELGELRLRGASGLVPLLGDGATPCEPEELAATLRTAVDGPGRTRATGFLAATAHAHGIPSSPALAVRLAAMREVLRERHPPTALDPRATRVLRFEAVTAIDETAFWLAGWIRHARPTDARLTAVSPEGTRVRVRPADVGFHKRSDVDGAFSDAAIANLGFHAYVELPCPSVHRHGWVLEHDDGRDVVEDVARTAVDDDHERLRARMLHALSIGPPAELTADHVLRALRRLRGREPVAIQQVTDYGHVRRAPDVSVVIAAERADLMVHQLIGFLDEPVAGGLEIVFVVAPEADAIGDALILHLHELYGVAFRVARLARLPSRAIALNLGASIARGRLLVLMRDDVFAARPGWIDALRGFHDELPGGGVLGPKLLYVDGAIADVGTTYRRGRGSARWTPEHPLRGLASTLPDARGPRGVQAVSDACIVVGAERFAACGGLSEAYVAGAHDGADLCLRLAEEGLETWCVAGVELYSLERRGWSRSPPLPGAQRFDDWLFHKRWGMRLAEAASGELAAATRLGALPARPWRVESDRSGAPVEIVRVTVQPTSDWVRDASLLRPRVGGELAPYENTYSMTIEGWAVGCGDEALRVEVHGDCNPPVSVPLAVERPDLAERFPDCPRAATAGFQTVIGTLDLPLDFELVLDLVGDAGERSPLATVRGRRRTIRPAFKPALQPILVTTLGRTGSSWLALLLATHPEIVAAKPFVYEARLTSYWMEVLRTLSAPRSYIQMLRPHLYPGSWWTGEHRPGPLPLRMAEPQLARWLGGASVEATAGFCQSRIDDFYRELARAEGGHEVRYFAEKCWPDEYTPRIVGELYPGGREILLVRDFRDMVCSIVGFNAKRGFLSFGREAADSDEDFIRDLRDGAARMLDGWRERRERAYLVRYEDLIQEPESTLAGVFSYLGVADGPTIVGRTIADAGTELPGSQRDHRTADSPAASIGRWKRDLSAEHLAVCDEAFGDLLDAFGYEPTVQGAATGPAPPAG